MGYAMKLPRHPHVPWKMTSPCPPDVLWQTSNEVNGVGYCGTSRTHLPLDKGRAGSAIEGWLCPEPRVWGRCTAETRQRQNMCEDGEISGTHWPEPPTLRPRPCVTLPTSEVVSTLQMSLSWELLSAKHCRRRRGRDAGGQMQHL